MVNQAQIDNFFKQLENTCPQIDPMVRESWLKSTIKASTEDAIAMNANQDSSQLLADTCKRVDKAIKRLDGFGGTDLGIMYMDHIGEFYPFTDDDGLPKNTASVIKTKLCLDPPVKSTGNMLRGIIMEDYVRREYLRQNSDRGLKQRNDLIDLFQEVNKNRLPDHPWLTGMPDDIFEDRGGKLHIVDYKVPATESSVSQMVANPPSMYIAQLATYKAILEMSGHEVSSTILAPMSTQKMEVNEVAVKIDSEMINTILKLGDEAWQHVKEGYLPMNEFKGEKRTVYEEVEPELEERIKQYLYYNKLHNAAGNKKEEIQKLLKYELGSRGMLPDDENKKISVPYLNLNRSMRKTLDMKKLAETFRDLDLNIDDYYNHSESESMNVIRSKKNPRYELVRSIEMLTSEVAQDGIHEVVDFENLPGLKKIEDQDAENEAELDEAFLTRLDDELGF